MLLAYETLGSAEKEYHLIGRDTGAQIDYCHGALLLGPHASVDVFPRVTEWLDRQLTKEG